MPAGNRLDDPESWRKYIDDPVLWKKLKEADWDDPVSFCKVLLPDSNIEIREELPVDLPKQASDTSHAIHEAFYQLRDIVQRHEETIQARWTKKSKAKKLKVLLDAWPNMPPINTPAWDFEYATPLGQAMADEHLMWPYINQEDLLKPKSLLLLINARARNHPNHFAAGDLQAAFYGAYNRVTLPIHPGDLIMVLNGATDANTYGKTELLDERVHKVRRGRLETQFLARDGMLILGIQQRTLEFLLGCCRAILSDIPPSDLVSDKYPVRPAPHLKTEAETSGFGSLAVMAAEAPYRLPAHIDFARMERLLGAKVAATKDRIWALREDPTYFCDHITEARDHRAETVKDMHGGTHPILLKENGSSFRARVIAAVISEAYCDFEMFTELHRQARELNLLYGKEAALISTTDDLPPDFLDRLLTFRHFLDKMTRPSFDKINNCSPSSPHLRRLFFRTWDKEYRDESVAPLRLSPRPNVKSTKLERTFLGQLRNFSDPKSVLTHYLGLPLLLDELDRLLASKPEAANLVSAKLAEYLSDLSILAHCQAQLSRFQPWASRFRNDAMDRAKSLDKTFQAWWLPLKSLFDALNCRAIMVPVADLADTSQKRFYHPTHKRPTKETIEALRNAEQNLDAFWEAFDRIIEAKFHGLRGTKVREMLGENRPLQRTPEWVGDEQPARQKGNHQKPVAADADKLHEPLAALHFTTPEPAARDKGHCGIQNKVKVKTKGQASKPVPTTEAVPDTAPFKDDIPPSIHVDSRALKVFRYLFYNPNVTSSPGEVPWLDFVNAMTSTGLFSAEKLYGSAWQFQRLDGEGQSSIIFHEPHPRAKIPFNMARRMGRRLDRAFGWDGATFVLKEDKKDSKKPASQ